MKFPFDLEFQPLKLLFKDGPASEKIRVNSVEDLYIPCHPNPPRYQHDQLHEKWLMNVMLQKYSQNVTELQTC
jgi:hypothetical protein